MIRPLGTNKFDLGGMEKVGEGRSNVHIVDGGSILIVGKSRDEWVGLQSMRTFLVVVL